ncbi:MAG: hypothetical protein ABI556_13680 [Gemmatimonadales bacterium]
MPSYEESRTPLGPPQPGIEWVNIITSQDHSFGNADGAFFAEIHLQINLASKDILRELEQVLSFQPADESEQTRKLEDVQRILKRELERAKRNNISTVAIVEAIKLR